MPNIYNIWRNTNHPPKNNEELKNMFENGAKNFQTVYRKGRKTIKECLINTNINAIDSTNFVSCGCYNRGRNCIHCKYLNEKVEYYYSYVAKQ